jgi:hypothetical protein
MGARTDRWKMDFFNSCFGEYTDASVLVQELPNDWGQHREDAIVKVVKDGNVPYFLRQWVPVQVSYGSHTGTFYVMPDYFAIGTDDDFVRTPMAPTTAEKIGSLLGARLPTKKMVDLIHIASEQKLKPEPMKPTSQMITRDYFVRHNEKVNAQFESNRYELGNLTSGHKKDVVVTSHMGGRTVCIYGWFRGDSPSTAIQGPRPNCKSHTLLYSDYSHGIRFVRDVMLVDGKEMLVDTVLKDPELSKLISDEGPFETVRYDSSSAPKTIVPGQVLTAAVFLALGFTAANQLLS